MRATTMNYTTTQAFFEALNARLAWLDSNNPNPKLEQLPDFSNLREDELEQLFGPLLRRTTECLRSIA